MVSILAKCAGLVLLAALATATTNNAASTWAGSADYCSPGCHTKQDAEDDACNLECLTEACDYDGDGKRCITDMKIPTRQQFQEALDYFTCTVTYDTLQNGCTAATGSASGSGSGSGSGSTTGSGSGDDGYEYGSGDATG